MRVSIKHIDNKKEEQVIIECVEICHEIEQIKAFVLSSGTMLTGEINGNFHQFELSDVYYFETVDKRVFAYTKDTVYALKTRLYKLQQTYSEHPFIRASKAVLVNLMKPDSIRPSLNGRFTARIIKKILPGFFVSVTCISVAIAVLGMLFLPNAHFGYSAFLSPLIFGIISVIPRLLTYSKKELSVKQICVRKVFYLVMLEAAIISINYFGGALVSYSVTLSLM